MNATDYMACYNAPLTGILRWPAWEALLDTLREMEDDWYVYCIGEAVPQHPMEPTRFLTFLSEIDQLLRNDHREDYLGIVYADNPQQPAFIKIYDPNNLGASCGSSGQRILPGWTLSRVPPIDLHAAFPPPGNRRRWWQKILG